MHSHRYGTLLLAVGLVFTLACDNKTATTVVEVRTEGRLIQGKLELRPDASPGAKARMVLGSLAFPVEVKLTPSPDKVAIELWAHEQPFEEEVYSNPSDGFGLIDAAGERYEPPVPLLKFPLRVGDSWDWKGKMVTGDTSRTASAKIITRDDLLRVGPETHKALAVDVDLEMHSGGPKPAKRKLIFWFVPEKGVMKREFGVSTSREPIPDLPPK